MLAATTTASVEARLELLVRQTPLLRRLLEEQCALVPGRVGAQASWRRLSAANRINELCQRLELDLAVAGCPAPWAGALREVRALAEAVLRENPVLQARGPLHVVRSGQMPDRCVLNREGRRERRKGFGLHREVRNDAGLSVVIAFTPPGYEQLWHAHTVDEYTLAVDASYLGRYADGAVGLLAAGKEELFHFHPYTYHTLVNADSHPARTFTLKSPLGVSVWMPALTLTGRERGRAEVRVVPREEDGRGVWLRRFQVEDPHHRYTVHVATLAPQARLDVTCEHGGYVYVLDGRVAAHGHGRSVVAGADDLIVAEPTPALWLRTVGGWARLYWASPVACPAVAATGEVGRRGAPLSALGAGVPPGPDGGRFHHLRRLQI